MTLQEAFDAGFEAVKAYVERSLDDVEARFDALEKKLADLAGPPEDGADIIKEMIDAAVGKAVSALPKPRDGQDGPTLEEIEASVLSAVAVIPQPQDGKSVTIEDVRPLIDDAVAKAVAALPVPKDGVGLAGAIIDRKGDLIVTLGDGSTRELGPVVGKDADMRALADLIVAEIAKIPVPKDGIDGVGFDDLDVAYDGARTITLSFVKGERLMEFPICMPVVLDQGVYKEGQSYEPGDGVTWAGSYWIARKENATRPGEGDAWRLAVKKGRDGKEVVTLPPDPAKQVSLNPKRV